VLAALLWITLEASRASAAQAAAVRETIVAIQVHGNTLTPDTEIRRLAGIQIGDSVNDQTVETVTQHLRDARKFESVQVLKRFASIADPSQILLVIIVDEGPVHVEMNGETAQAVKSKRINLMFLPIISAEDGYGLTYGARFAVPNPLGANSRIGFPLTWGGDKRAAVELDKTFTAGPFDRIAGGGAVSRRTNPYYEIDDDRVRLWIRGERHVAKWLRAGGTAGSQRVNFQPSSIAPRRTDSFGHGGADLTFDTRVDPILPRNAVYARAAWEHIGGANRTDFDARGYVGLFGQTIGQVRFLRSDSDRPLAPYLKPLLGGMSNLRGFKAGTKAGDTLVAASAELVVPLSSPISVGRIGVSAFIDAGTAYDDGQRLSDQEWMRGIGGSMWFSAAFFRMNIAIAHGHGSSTRVHVGATVGF